MGGRGNRHLVTALNEPLGDLAHNFLRASYGWGVEFNGMKDFH
jgi:hypothetical protein